MGWKAVGSEAGNSSTRHQKDSRSATQTPSQDPQSDGSSGNTGRVSGQQRTYEELARNNEGLAQRNEEWEESLEMATAWALAEQEKTNYAQKQLVKSVRKLERSKRWNKACRKATRRAKADWLIQMMGQC